MDLRPGAMLSAQLQLERELGAGGMGSVWVARRGTQGGLVAVKVLHPIHGAHAAAQRARFEQEARVLARLDHPHLVKIYDFGMTGDGDPYIVMELLQGEDLAERIKRVGAIGLVETTRIVGQICNALTCAHAAGVVHRDVKPANVFLTSQAATGETFVKLVDFGVAKFASGELGMTRTGDMIGTPYFMSPEQFLTPKAVDARSDLWSLAVVVYACVTGQLPFAGETLAALSMAVTSGRFQLPRTHRGDLPVAVDHFMTRVLSTDPSGRYGTAQEFAEALGRAVAAGASVAFASTDRPPPPGASQLGAPAPSGAGTSQHVHAISALAVPTRASRGTPRWLMPVLGAAALAIAALAVVYFTQSQRSARGAKASASALAGAAPVDLANTSLDGLYARALREAKKKQDSAELTSISYSDVLPDGALTSDGRAKYQFGTANWRCIVVVMTSEGVETKVEKCAKETAIPYPPRCSLAEVRTRMRHLPQVPGNLVYAQVASTSPQWYVSAGFGHGASFPDDCR